MLHTWKTDYLNSKSKMSTWKMPLLKTLQLNKCRSVDDIKQIWIFDTKLYVDDSIISQKLDEIEEEVIEKYYQSLGRVSFLKNILYRSVFDE